jgi:hypothetical protein
MTDGNDAECAAANIKTQVVTYTSPLMLKASTNRKTFSSNPRAVTA